MTRDQSKKAIQDLVQKYAPNAAAYADAASTYNETQARTDFITPFLEALGWDVRNSNHLPEDQRDVIEEATVEVGPEKLSKKPDYELRAARRRKFFVEAKRPSKAIQSDKDSALNPARRGPGTPAGRQRQDSSQAGGKSQRGSLRNPTIRGR